MAISRRNLFKLSVSVAAATALVGCNNSESSNGSSSAAPKDIIKHQVVIIGGGFGGLTVAKQLKRADKNFDVLVIEKNDTFMSCPFSNTNLGKLKNINLGTFVFDYAQTVEANGYKMLQSTVTSIDRKAKTVTTAAGTIGYEILILSPGIAYNYEAQFPTWSKEKIAHIQRVAPGALIPGKEHITLERNLVDMEDGNVIITVPSGKFRCPPAPFERACMIAAYMKKEEIAGKVIILNETSNIAKGAAFKEAWKELYGDIIEHHADCKLKDVDTSKKSVTFAQTVYKNADDLDGTTTEKTLNYEVLNLIPYNRSNPVIEMADIETTSDTFGKVKMNGCSFATKTDPDVYAIGDVTGHALPPSGQTANWQGVQCAKEVAHRLHNKPFEHSVKTKVQKAGNVCFSMVGDRPEEGISVIHDFSWTGTVIKGKGHVPKDSKTGKYRSRRTAKATHEWYRGIMSDLFS
jgi:NADPH-dependent 2,4-dienoyl-CoA reductase/sulfur reductase-like enzyme